MLVKALIDGNPVVYKSPFAVAKWAEMAANRAEMAAQRAEQVAADGSFQKALNAMEAKCDWLLMSDAKGTVAFRILPDIVYAHTGIGGGFFPPGSYYQGAEVRALADAPTHLTYLINALHPNAVKLNILKIKRLPG